MWGVAIKWLKYCCIGYVGSLLFVSVILIFIINQKEKQLDHKFPIETVMNIQDHSLELPQRFYEIYNIMFPGSLENNYIESLIGRYQNSCPCNQMSY